MATFLLPAVQLTAAESAAEATLLTAWLLVGAVGLVIGLVLVIRANRQFTQRRTHGFTRVSVDTRSIETSYQRAA